MNVFKRLAPARWRILGLVAAAAAVAMAGGLALSVVPEAHAESGRRICVYSNFWKPKDVTEEQKQAEPRLDDPLVKISLALDYKKDGKCPWMNPQRLHHFTGNLVSVDSVFRDPVQKETCEAWGDKHHLSKTDLGDDPCAKMEDDRVFAIFWWDPTLPQHADKAPEYKVLEHYAWFQG